MIVDRRDRVLVHGITGRQGRFWTERMCECGTMIVAGTSPGKGGQKVANVPVYNSIEETVVEHRPTVSVFFTPPLQTREAALGALHAGIRKLVLLTEFIPVHDTLEIVAEGREHDAQILGPNTAGIVVPGEAAIGIMPAFSERIFRPGSIGVISRSGSLGTLTCLNLVRGGYGQSAFIGIGGDPIVGTTTLEALTVLEQHRPTKAVVLVGEIGGVMEEEAAPFVATMTKPVVTFIAGRQAPPGQRMGHAGAIVTSGMGGWDSKATALAEAGATVLATPAEIGSALNQVLRRNGGSCGGSH